METSKKFWQNYLAGYESLATLPRDTVVSVEKRHEKSVQKFVLTKERTKALKDISGNYGVTLNTILQTAWGLVLSKYNNTTDVVFGSVVSGRPAELSGIESIVGLFINTVPVRINCNEINTIRDLLQRMQQLAVEGESHHHFPLSEIQSSSALGNALLDHIMVVENYPVAEEIEGRNDVVDAFYRVTGVEIFTQTNYDLTLVVHPGDEILIDFEYRPAYTDETISRLIDHFSVVVELIEKDVSQPVSQIDITTSLERDQLLYEFNNNRVDYSNRTVLDLFADQVKQNAGSTAITCKSNALSYSELDETSTKLAVHLRSLGVKTNELVGILLDPSELLLVSILAVLKAGGGFVPIDKHYPQARKKYMIENSNLQVLISSAYLIEDNVDLITNLPDINVIDVTSVELADKGKPQIPSAVSSKDLAYVLYTSGSTGRPKGVQIEHGSLFNYMSWANSTYVRGKDSPMALFSSVSFDLTITSMFLPLISGNPLHIYEQSDQSVLIEQVISEGKAKVVKLTPSHLRIIKDSDVDLTKINCFIVGGEQLDSKLAAAIQDRGHEHLNIYNEYGPTEATIGCVVHCFKREEAGLRSGVLIGRPAPNNEIYIFDDQMRLMPVGVFGEMYIGGSQLTRGYISSEEQTRARLIDHPYKSGKLIYKTGDLARWHADGNIEFLGRKDDQVKIRGFRIELGEIESQLKTHEAVSSVFVAAMEKEGDKYLTTYYTAEKEIVDLKQYLKDRLPEYMIPSYFVKVEEIPLTANGKADRKALPHPEALSQEVYVAPSNEIEEQLAGIWSEILKVDKNTISRESNFFELGGHSLKLIFLANKLKKVYNTKFELPELMELNTISKLAMGVSRAEVDQYQPIRPVSKKLYYNLSSAQKRLYFLHEFDKISLAYNMPHVVKLEGRLDPEKVEDTFKKLIARHESLRTAIVMVDGVPFQQIKDEVVFSLECHESEEAGCVDIIQAFIRPFDLSRSPLIRAGLIKISAQTHLLMVDLHHIISDGVSQSMLIKDFMALYKELKLPALKLHYKDYAEWQQSTEQQALLEKQRKFWKQEFSEDVSVLNLPTDHPRPLIKSYEGDNSFFFFDKEKTAQLRKLTDESGATLFMTILSIVNIFLSKLGNQEDIAIGTPVAGRDHADLEGIMGMFVNTLVLRNYPKGEVRFSEFLAEVKSKTLSCFENQAYQYEELIEELDITRDTGRNPLFDVMLVFQNFEEEELVIPGLKLQSYDSGHSVSKFDLTITAGEADEHLYVNLGYSTDLFSAATIDRFITYFERIVEAVATDFDKKLSEIDILSF
ncbi:amino acid adenylation domain-containing protein, partial [Fulvivirga imtechensis]|uniref:amino acid adenylation domain-containing protein n=1 Tax=Fulvivirga imtechensis TaxID=881893 RepID=UPI001FDFDF34